MENPERIQKISVIWRTSKYALEVDLDSTVRELGQKLQKLTEVEEDTMRLIVPKFSNKSSKMLFPFSDEHGCLMLREMSFEGKPIRMMGVSKDEVEEVLKEAKKDFRIAGFDEEDSRLRQRASYMPQSSLKLPQGPYTFCEFRTLQLPGVELYPPASDALKRMHMLAADPGIVAIMDKYRWRVGVMTEMAPIGKVGVSPKCLLGLNKNKGEEISLRLRTDDLKGFRKYETIKKTLLHELAHMVYTEHDANFYAFDKKLNEEASSLDWTKAKGHILTGVGRSKLGEENFYVTESSMSSQKLGGDTSRQLYSARASSVTAAYQRLTQAAAISPGTSKVHEEPDPDDAGVTLKEEPDLIDSTGEGNLRNRSSDKALWNVEHEPDPLSPSDDQIKLEPDPDSDDEFDHQIKLEPDPDDLNEHSDDRIKLEPDPDEHFDGRIKLEPDPDEHFDDRMKLEPDPDEHFDDGMKFEPDPDEHFDGRIKLKPDPDEHFDGRSNLEPDPDEYFDERTKVEIDLVDMEASSTILESANGSRPDAAGPQVTEIIKDQTSSRMSCKAHEPEGTNSNGVVRIELESDDNMVKPGRLSQMQIDEPDPGDQEIKRINDPVTVICNRLQKAIETLQAEVNPAEGTTVLQTLSKIIRNVIEHPDEMKYKRLRKGNPLIQRTIANYKGAMEILFLIGFIEDVVLDELGKAETFLVLKRNDPGLFWLAKSSIESSTV